MDTTAACACLPVVRSIWESRGMASRRRTDPCELDEVRALVRDAQAGDREAFASLFRRFQSFVLGCFLSTGAAYDESWDLTQETFLHALRGLHTLDLRCEVRFGGWLSVIARNVARKHSIRQRDSNTVQFDETCFPDVMGAAGAPTEDYSALAQCLDLLGIELRRPVLYKFFLGFPNRKIATLLTSSEATVRNRLASAMVELRACLESKGASFE